MVLQKKHIAQGLAGLLIAAAIGAASFAASVTVQPAADYTRLNFAFDQPAKLQVAGGGRDLILNFDQPVDQSASTLQERLGDIANGVQQSSDGKQIILNLKKNYRVRQFTSGNGVGIDIMASGSPSPTELAQVPKPAPKPEPKPAAKPEVITPPANAEPVKIVAPRAQVPSVKVITPETLKETESPKAPTPAAAVAEVKEEQALPEAKVIRVAPPSILTTKDDASPVNEEISPPVGESAPAAEAPITAEGAPDPTVNPADVLGPIADPILTTKEFQPEPTPATAEVKPEPLPQDAPAAKPDEEMNAAVEEAAPAAAVQAAAPPADPDAPFLVGVKKTKAGTELYFPWPQRTAAAVFERGSDIWIVFNKPVDANVALLRTVLPKAVIRTEQFAYEGATVLRLSTDGNLHASVGQPKNSYGWTVTLAPSVGTAAQDIPLSGEVDESGKSYLLLAAFDTGEPLRFFDPIIGDLLILVPTHELGRGVVNTRTTAELTVLRTPQGIAVASLRDDLQTRQDRTGVLFFADQSLAVSQNLPVLTAQAAPVPGVSSASGVMIPYDQWYVSPAEFGDVLGRRLQELAIAKESGKADALRALVQLYMGQSMTSEALGFLTILKDEHPEYYVANKLALLSAACNLLNGRVPQAMDDIQAPELVDLPEAQVWREAISLVAIDPNAANIAVGQAEPPAEAAPESTDAQNPVAAAPEAVEEEEEEEEVGEAAQAQAAADAVGAAPEATGTIPAPATASEQPTQEVQDAPVAETAKPVTTQGTPETTASETALAPEAAAEAVAVAPPMKREFNFLDFNKSFIRYYPPRIRQKLAIMAADAYLQNGQPEKSVMTYETLNSDGILQGVQPYAEYMLGTIAASKKKTKEALKVWDRMSRQQEDPYIRARARFAAIMLRLDRGMITAPEAIDQLERLRMSWRGDGLEREMLQTLAKMYHEEKQYDNQLRSMKYLLQSFPGEVDALTLAGDMSELFEELFLHGLADEMPALKSLGLFYEFRELTPIGDKGDLIIQKLADRLASVDLLERATQLLENQVRFRVSGEARARVGARLSLLYLLNKEPQRALEVLEITNYGAMDTDLKRQRNQLTAQALAENKRPEQGLSLLTNDMSEEGGLLRLDILWGMQDWPNVINAAEDILGRRANLTEPLSPRETPVLLKLALAYAFEEDPTQLRYLRDYYMALVPEGPYKEIFDYLTNDTAPLDADDFQLVAKQISRTESFMDTFKTKIAQGRLSEVAKEPATAEAPTAVPAAEAPAAPEAGAPTN